MTLEIALKWKYRRPQTNGTQKAPASGHANAKKNKRAPTDREKALHAKQPNKVMVLTASGKRKMIIV